LILLVFRTELGLTVQLFLTGTVTDFFAVLIFLAAAAAAATTAKAADAEVEDDAVTQM
jgi:hypothetical protein